MEDTDSILSVVDAVFPLPAPVVDWEAKYKESVAQRELTLTSYSKLLADRDQTMAVISDMFFDEAEKREWCKEAFDFIESINSALPHGFFIPVRLQEFTVRVTVTGEISQHYDVAVDARSQEEANSMVSEYPDDHFDPDDVLRTMNIRSADIENIEVTVD